MNKSSFIILIFLIVCSGVVFAANPQQLAANTSGYWCLDETSGTAVDCYRGQFNLTQSGTVNNGGGILGNSRGTFSDANYLSSSTFANFTGVQSYSISAFVFAPAAPAGTNTFYSMTSANYARTTRYETGTSKTQFMYLDGGNSADYSAALNSGQWYHVVASYNGSSGNASIYVNGVFRQSGTTAGTPANNNGQIRLGRDTPGGNPAASFRIDEVAVFNIPLTADDAYYIYNLTVNGTRYWNISTVSSNFTLTALDQVTSAPLENFSALISGPGGYNVLWNTTTSQINTTLLQNNTFLYNITFISNQNGGYFNRTYLLYNLSNNLAGVLHQAKANFTASEFATLNNITGGNVTINGLTLPQNVQFNLSRGNFTLTYRHSSYFTKTYAFEILPLEIKTVNITNVSNVLVNVTVRDSYNNNLALSNISIIGVSYTSYNSSVTSVNTLNDTGLINGTYEFRIISAGYISNFSNFSFISLNTSNITFYLVNDNNFTVSIFDENTFLPVYSVNWSVSSSTGIGQGLNGSTSNISNSFNFAGLSRGDYEIRYQGANYRPRSYYISIPATAPSQVNLSLYDVTTNASSPFIVTTTDKSNQFVSGLTVSLLRRYTLNGQTVFFVVEQSKPIQSLAGASIMYAVPNTIPYLFRVTDSSGTVKYQGSATTSSNYETLYLIDQYLYLRIESADQTFTKFYSSSNFSVALTNVSNTFWLSYSSIPSSFDELCLQVSENSNTILSTQCTTTQSGILSYSLTNVTNASYYIAQAYLKDTSNNTFIVGTDVIENDRVGSQIFGIVGLFMLLISLVLFGFGFAHKPALMVLGMVLSVLAFSTQFLNIVTLSVTVQSTILIVGLIVAAVLRE